MRFVKITLSALAAVTLVMAAGCGNNASGGEVKAEGPPNPHTSTIAAPKAMAPTQGKTQSVKPSAQ